MSGIWKQCCLHTPSVGRLPGASICQGAMQIDLPRTEIYPEFRLFEKSAKSAPPSMLACSPGFYNCATREQMLRAGFQFLVRLGLKFIKLVVYPLIFSWAKAPALYVTMSQLKIATTCDNLRFIFRLSRLSKCQNII